MRTSLLAIPALLQLVRAIPAPQAIDLDLVESTKDPVQYEVPVGAGSQTITYKLAAVSAAAAAPITSKQPEADSVASTRRKRAACDPQPLGAGPQSTPDDANAFIQNEAMCDAANDAQTPAGYVKTYNNLHASSLAYGYLGYTTITKYDPLICSAKCDAMDGCASFNIFFERAPVLEPADTCPNPASTSVIKCAFWGGPINIENAKNDGQYRNDFHVVISGSNGYMNKTIDPAAGYTVPTYLGTAAINAPPDCAGASTYMGYKLFTEGPFDSSLCAKACSSQSAYNLAHPPTDGSAPQTCQFFNTYLLLKNGANQGQYCSMYTQSWDSSYATNVGQYNNEGDHFTISYSYTFSNSTNPGKCSGPEILSCPAANGKTIVSNGKSFLIECSIDHAGGDLTMTRSKTLQGCVDACATNSQCKAYAWVAGSDNMPCYLKSSIGAANPNKGVWGGKLVSQ